MVVHVKFPISTSVQWRNHPKIFDRVIQLYFKSAIKLGIRTKNITISVNMQVDKNWIPHLHNMTNTWLSFKVCYWYHFLSWLDWPKIILGVSKCLVQKCQTNYGIWDELNLIGLLIQICKLFQKIEHKS